MNEPTQRINHTFRGHTFWMDVKMAALEAETFRNIAEIARSNNLDALAQVFAATIVDWDITMGDEPFPPTVENLMSVPIDLWHEIQKALSTAALSNATIELAGAIKESTGANQVH